MLREEMGMEATRLIQTNRRHMLQKELFLRWVIKCVMPWRSKRRIADKHFLRSRGKYIFKLMRKYVKGRQELHGATKKKYTGRQRWEMRHNLHVIKLHHQHRLLKTHFLSWRTRAHQRAIVKRSFQGHINTLATNVLKAWRLEAEKQIKIKAVCVAEWRLYGMSLYKIPFRAWYVYAKKRKEANFTRDTLIRAWDRRKIRSLLYQIFKVWRHQALYGKTEGMHTRLELIKVVEDQKKVQQMMSRNLDGAEDALRELKKALDQEKANNNKLKKEVENARREREKYDFASHNAEQDIVRLQSLLDSVSLIHPGTIKQLKALDESRSFKDRGIEDLARARSQRAVSQQPASEEKPTSKHAPPPLRKDKLEKGPTMGNGGKGLDIPDILYRKGLARRGESCSMACERHMERERDRVLERLLHKAVVERGWRTPAIVGEPPPTATIRLLPNIEDMDVDDMSPLEEAEHSSDVDDVTEYAEHCTCGG